MKTALVTGSAGFVGRHMVTELLARGYTVNCWDIADSIDCLAGFGWDSDRYDLVVHAAARSPHRAAIDGSPGIHPYNQLLDAAMFDWAIRTRQRHVLYLSSSAAYPVGAQAGNTPYRLHEDDADPNMPVTSELLAAVGFAAPLRPDASYGWTKLTGEQMAAAARSCGVPVTVVRPFSGYGADQTEDFPFRALLERACRREDPFTIWGDGRQVRDWIHIDDVVNGALAVAGAYARNPVNLCTGVGTSMLDLARMACAAVGYEPEFAFQADKPAGVAYRVGDPTRLHRYYTPAVDLAAGVKQALG